MATLHLQNSDNLKLFYRTMCNIFSLFLSSSVCHFRWDKSNQCAIRVTTRHICLTSESSIRGRKWVRFYKFQQAIFFLVWRENSATYSESIKPYPNLWIFARYWWSHGVSCFVLIFIFGFVLLNISTVYVNVWYDLLTLKIQKNWGSS